MASGFRLRGPIVRGNIAPMKYCCADGYQRRPAGPPVSAPYAANEGGTMSWSRITQTAVLGTLVLSLTGCSFLFVQGPPTYAQDVAYIQCTESNVLPTLDFIWGGLNLVGAIAIGQDPDSYDNSDAAILSGLAWAILSTWSGATGLDRTDACREARRRASIAARAQPLLAPAPTPTGIAAGVAEVLITPAVDTARIGQTIQLRATAYHSSGGVAPNQTFAWSSSNDAIASVGRAGLVTAHASGAVVIAARTGSVTGIARIMVVEADGTIPFLGLTPSSSPAWQTRTWLPPWQEQNREILP